MNNEFSRRKFLAATALGILAVKSDLTQPMNEKDQKEMFVYIGTYTTRTKSEGIYIYKLNIASGELLPYKTAKGAVDPSYLAIDKHRKFLYAVNETEDYEGKKSGAVSAYRIDEKTGELTSINKQASFGGAPCYTTVSDNGKFVLVANYSGGSAASFPVETDGKIGAAIDLEQHSGSSVNKKRQESAHVHSVTLDRQNNYAIVCDLGLDKAFIYEFDDKTGKLETNPSQPFYQTKAGAGPRHFAFHPHHDFAYLINELDSTIIAFKYDQDKGTLAEIQIVSALPTGYVSSAKDTCADIHLSPDGKFLYGSNRGHDSLVSFAIEEKSGRLEYVEHVPTGGKTPRNFAIDPTGSFLLAANQNSNNIVVFRRDEKSGKLSNTGFSVSVPSPVCVKLIPSKD